MADLPIPFVAEPVRERGYTNDSAIDRDALLTRNVRVLAKQRATAVEVAALVGLTVEAVDAIAVEQGTPPACPICGASRVRKTRGRRLAKTCGDPACRAALMARSRSGPRKPLTRTHRKRIGAGLRRYWEAHPEGQPTDVRARMSEAQRRRWARQAMLPKGTDG